MQGVVGTSKSVTCAAYGTVDVSITYTCPEGGYYPYPVLGFVRSTGWAGLICQGMAINGNSITYNIYNTTSAPRSCTLNTIALYNKNRP